MIRLCRSARRPAISISNSLVGPDLQDHPRINGIIFGQFKPISAENNQVLIAPKFVGVHRKSSVWDGIPKNVLYHILDLWQVEYLDREVMAALDIPSVPDINYIYARLGRCSLCFQIGHTSSNCSATICDSCNNFEQACFCKSENVCRRPIICDICNGDSHRSVICPSKWKCSICGLLGHTG